MNSIEPKLNSFHILNKTKLSEVKQNEMSSNEYNEETNYFQETSEIQEENLSSSTNTSLVAVLGTSPNYELLIYSIFLRTVLIHPHNNRKLFVGVGVL